jgi:hypothetical protein
MLEGLPPYYLTIFEINIGKSIGYTKNAIHKKKGLTQSSKDLNHWLDSQVVIMYQWWVHLPLTAMMGTRHLSGVYKYD